MIAKRLLVAVVCALSVSTVTRGQSSSPATTDWPQWRGPERTGISRETGLLQQWPAGGPAVAWSITGVGAGYGTAAIRGSQLFIQGMRGRDTMVHGINLADGKYLWSKNLGSAGSNDRGSGPRSTPTIDGDRVIVTPGGSGAGIVALDKMTGKTIWTSKELSDEAGYASAIAIEVQGIRAYTTFTANAAVGVRATDGKLMWSYRTAANGTANITTPVFFQDKVFYTSDYGTGAGLVTLRPQNGSLAATENYFTRDMQNHHGGVVLVGGTIYGFSNAILTALDFATGKMLWRDRSVGKGSVSYADNRLYMLSEDNVVGLAEVTPKGYREVGRFTIADQGLPSWSHPVVSGGRMYIRNQNVLTAYDVRARQ